jgi:hypothetical protein
MKKYIYSPHHQGAVLAPLMEKPDKYFGPTQYKSAMEAYNTWLSSPPIYKVRPEDIEWFSVERGEDEFEVKRTARFEAEITEGTVKRFAIPKKGNESKEQRPSVEQGYSEAEVKEILANQRINCAEAYLADRHDSYDTILNAPEPQLKSSLK